MERIMSGVGLVVMIGLAYVLSSSRKDVKWKTVITGITLQLIFGLLILKTPIGFKVFEAAKDLFGNILAYTDEGSKFVFGGMADPKNLGFIFATMVLPTIIFMSYLLAPLFTAVLSKSACVKVASSR